MLIAESKLADLHDIDKSGHPYHFRKRVGDVLLSVLGLPAALIPMAVIVLTVYLDDLGNVCCSKRCRT